MIKIENGVAYSTEGKYVYRKGHECHIGQRRHTTLPDDTADDFVELDEMPPMSVDELAATGGVDDSPATGGAPDLPTNE